MTTNDQRVARALKKSVDTVGGLPDSPEARARTVAALQAAMTTGAAQPAQRRHAGRWALAAGLALLAGAGLWWRAQPRAVARVVASSGTLQVGHQLAEAAVVESGQAAMTLELARGVNLQLRPETTVQLRDDGARVVVRHGAVAAEVTAREGLFFLESGDTQVSTRGAKLEVQSGAGCDGRARVEVSEGEVSVNGARVSAGEAWPRCAAELPSEPLRPEAPPAPVEVTQPEAAPVHPDGPPPAHPDGLLPAHPDGLPPAHPERSRGTGAQKEEDRLARQNELYLQAVTLQRAGDVSGAVKKLEAVLADPKSPLAETALAQKMKWLSANHRPAAQEAAREYLQRFPMGFGRADAETLVLEPK